MTPETGTTERTLLKSMLQQTCPRCRRGRMFESAVYSRHFLRMLPACPQCGQSFILEPSFYTGAMYVSYGLQVALIAAVSLCLFVLLDPEWWVYLVSIIGALLLLTPLTYRLSRSIWIHMFVRYSPEQKTDA